MQALGCLVGSVCCPASSITQLYQDSLTLYFSIQRSSSQGCEPERWGPSRGQSTAAPPVPERPTQALPAAHTLRCPVSGGRQQPHHIRQLRSQGKTHSKSKTTPSGVHTG